MKRFSCDSDTKKLRKFRPPETFFLALATLSRGGLELNKFTKRR